MSQLDAFGRRILEAYFGLDTSSQEPLLGTLVSQELAGGEWLFHQGDPGDGLYFLLRGRLQVWRESSPGYPSDLLGEVLPGECVGEVGLLTHAPRSAGTRAVRDSLLVRVGRQTFDALAGRHPELIMRVAASVAERLQRNTAAERPVRPELKSVAIIVMDEDRELLALADGLIDELCSDGHALALRRESLAGLGAPGDVTVSDPDLTPALKHWIGGLEQIHQRIVYRVSPADGSWLRYAARQADLVVRLAPADSPVALRTWETDLDDHLKVGFDARQVLLLWHPPGTAIEETAAWLALRPQMTPLHWRADHSRDRQRILRVLSDRATGLVLSGGAARGFAHLGVYRAMDELGIPIDWLGGTSIGAIMSFAIALDLDVEEAIASVRTAFVVGRPFSDYTLPLISLLRGGRMRRLSQAHFPGVIEDLPLPCFCISSNLGTGAANIHERGSVWQAICASAALPGVMPPTIHDGQLAVDGAMLNNLPVDVMQEKLVRHVVAVDLTSRQQVDVTYDEVPSPWAVLAGLLLLPFSKRYGVPGAATTILKATELGTRRRVLELAARADLLLRPPVHSFSMLSVNQFDELVEAGYQHAMERGSAWLEKRQLR